MKKNVFIIAAISSFIAMSATAQTTTFNNDGAAADAVEDLEEQIEEDRDRDIGRFGNEGRDLGAYGSLALRGTSTNNDGVTDSDFGVGLRYGTYDGVNGIDITANIAYGETDGVETKNTLLAGADYNDGALEHSRRRVHNDVVDRARPAQSCTARVPLSQGL